MAKVRITAVGVSPRGGKAIARKASKVLTGVGNRMASMGKTLRNATPVVGGPTLPNRGKR